MKRIALISITLLILIIGISCASAATVDHSGNSTLKKDNGGSAVKLNSSSLKTISKNTTVKNNTKKSSNNTVKSNSTKKSTNDTVKSNSTKKSTNDTVKSNSTKKVDAKKTVRPCDKVINGWDPKKHQVSCESMGDGLYRITYDDGYHRLVDSEGNILSYGY